jgi:hypothetical protein
MIEIVLNDRVGRSLALAACVFASHPLERG